MKNQCCPTEEQVKSHREVLSLNVQQLGDFLIKRKDELLIKECLYLAQNCLRDLQQERALADQISILLVLEVRFRTALSQPFSEVCKVHILIDKVASDNGRDSLEALELVFDQFCD